VAPRNGPGARRALLGVAVLAAILFLAHEGLRPPAPKAVAAPATEFSAGRAREVLNRLVGDGVPHPTGSPANDAVRARVIEEFTKIGYKPEVQTGFGCDEFGTCATVKNVLARLDGTAGTGAVLLAAHYDSVPAGPGASDDGAGAATVLEVARALKASPIPRNPVIILIDDGEEPGLLGARVFVDKHPWAKEVRAAVNVDSRGSSGSSLMFETGAANYWAVDLYARHAARPATNSIFYTAYKQFPNDTDFTIFKAAGFQGLNFANVANVAHYHTPLDNFANADPGTLQHHGENALPSVLALANSDLSKLAQEPATATVDLAGDPQRDAVYFDIFERGVIYWRVARTLGFAIGAAGILLLEIAWMLWRKRLTPPAFIWGLLAWLAMILVVAGLAYALLWALRKAGALSVNWVAHPLPLELAFAALAAAVVCSFADALARKAGFLGLWAGVWLWWALLSVVSAWQAPQLSYIVVVPTCVAAVAGLPMALWPGGEPRAAALATIIPLAAAGIVSFGPLLLLYTGLGNPILPVTSILSALVLTPFAPLCADLRTARGLTRLSIPAVTIVATLLSAFAAIVAPPFSAKAPERVNFIYWLDADSGNSHWVVKPASGRLPEPIRVATNFQRVEKGPFPWSSNPAFLADSPHLEFRAPTFTILESSVNGGRRSYRALLRSERGAPVAAALIEPGAAIDSVRMEGEPVQPETEVLRRFLNGWLLYECRTMPAKGVEITFTLPVDKPVEIQVMDQSYGMPLEGMFLLKSRPLTATPSQDGDVTIVTRHVQLIP